MSRKSILIVLLLTVTLCCTACSKLTPQQKAEFELQMNGFMREYQNDEHYVARLMLHGGGYLVVNDVTEDWFVYKDYSYDILSIFDGKLDIKEAVYRSDESIDIFYMIEEGGGFSEFFVYEGYKGTDYLVFVTPDAHYGWTYETSPDREYVPYDTLNTEPLMIQDEEYQDNCPIWIFDLAASTVTDSYELHYGDYVLTGKNLKSRFWDPPEDKHVPMVPVD